MSVSNKLNGNSEHQEVWNLLPWFINQSLSEAENSRVKNHVKSCITCRIELKQQQQVYESILQTDLMQQLSNASFRQLKKRIEIQPVSQLNTHQKQPVDVRKWPFQFPGFAKQFALAASLLLLTATVIFNVLIEEPEISGSEFRTLASPVESQQQNQNLIRVIFTDETEPAQIETILSSLSGHIVNGPSRNGIYDVRIDDEQTQSNRIPDTIMRLRDNSSVIFAEMAHVPLSHD